MKRGLVLGKFLPPHKGHLHLIEEAAKQCDLLTVIVGTLGAEPIDGNLRFQWMRALCPDQRVLHLTDENPQYPEEHPEFWHIWRSSIQRLHPELLDIVFSSEDYGDRLAAELGARHICVDRERFAFPISGSELRKRPLSNYGFLPKPVRPYFHKKIVITGAESTGKTVTSRHLANRFNTVWAHEYAREYLERMGRFVIESDIPDIARGQVALEDKMRLSANRIYFCDTDLMATCVYSKYYFGQTPTALRKAMDERPGDLYLFMDIDIPWVADPQRDSSDMRHHLKEQFMSEVHRYNVPFRIIGGSFSKRLEAAVQAVEDYVSRF